MIEVRDLRMAYRSVALRRLGDLFSAGTPRLALDGVSLRVAEGEAAAVVGENGAGKTTLLKILAALVIPASGEARLGGADVLREPLRAKHLAGFMSSQERSFYWRLTVRRNLEFFAALYGMSRREAAARVEALAHATGLAPHLDAPFRSLSSGLQQRAGLARALLHRPRVLLLDEPTRSLDPAAARAYLDLMERIRREERLTVLFSTHAARELPLAGRVHVLRRGRFVWEGSPAELAARGGGSAENGLVAAMGEGGET